MSISPNSIVPTESGSGSPAPSPQGLSADLFAVGLATLDLEGAVMAHNACWSALLGGAGAGVRIAVLVHPEDTAAWRGWIDDLAARSPGDGSEAMRLRFVHPDKGLHWLAFKGVRQADRLAVVAQDVTHSQRELAGAMVDARSLRALVDGFPGLIYRGRNNRDWTMEVISRGCMALTGHPAEDMRDGRRVQYSSLIVPEDVDYVWDSVQEALRSHRPYTLAYRIRSADGRLRKVLEKGQGVYSASGEVLAIEGAMCELTADVLDRLGSLGLGVEA